MTELFMLDTDICSYAIRGTNPALNKKLKKHKGVLCISAISYAELLFGAAKRKSERLSMAVSMFSQLVEVRIWTPEAAEKYAEIRLALEGKGMPVGNMDMLIAASALAENACLVTNNTAHFSRIKELKHVNWH